MVFIGFCLLGILSLPYIPISLLPNIDFPQLTIITSFPTASPEEIENIISKPISELVGTIQGVEKVESISKEGNSFVHLRFKNGTEMSYALLEVREKLDFIRDILPSEASKPMISKYDPSKRAFMDIVFSPKELVDQKMLRTYVDENIKLYFERIDGISLVEVKGGFEKEIFIELDPIRMNAYKMDPDSLKNLVRSANKNYPAGQIPFGNKELPVRMMGEFRSIADLSQMIVKGGENRAFVRLGEISNIIERYKERRGFATFNGEEAVIISLYKEPGKNTVELSKNVTSVLSQVNDTFGSDAEGSISYDESKFITDSLNGVYINLLLGSFLAYVTLLVLLKNYLSPAILLSAIPLTLLPSFFIFERLGIGFNMMSLGGLALGIGMLFDSSNVVLSAIERNLPLYDKLEDAVYQGTIEVSSSVFSATATTIIVFFPIGFIKSTLGMIFREMAFSIVITLTFSLITSVTFIPLVSSYLYKWRNKNESKFFLFQFYKEDSCVKIYHKYLELFLKKHKNFFGFILFLFCLSLLVTPILEKEYLPRVDTGEVLLNVRLPKGTRLSVLQDYVSYIESLLLKEEDVKSIITILGEGNENSFLNPNAFADSNQAELKILLKEKRNLSSHQFVSNMNAKFPKKDRQTLFFETKENLLGELLSENRNEIVYHIVGEDITELMEVGKNLKLRLLMVPGIQWIHLDSEENGVEYQVFYDQEKLSKYGLTSSALSNFLKISIKGMLSSEIKKEGATIPVRLGMKNIHTDSLQKIENLQIMAPNGEHVYLDQLITIVEKKSNLQIIRIGNQRVIPIRIGMSDRQKNIKSKIQSVISSFPKQDRIQIRESGEREKLDESLLDVGTSFALALLFVYMLLSGQFESYRISFVMLATIPLIFIGTSPALLLFGKSLNISSFMGFILLLGVVVDNASLYFEYFHLFMKQFHDPLEAMLVSTQTVLRPILMNNGTTILGMMPILISFHKGSEFQVPLAIVVIFGLLVSVILSLFVIPILFYFIEAKKQNHVV